MKVVTRSVLAAFGYRVQGTRYTPRQLLDAKNLRAIEFDDIVCRRIFEVGPRLSFVQIGAYDGITQDPLRKYIEKCGWRGVMVEPQARAANGLRELYDGNGSIVVLRAAVGDKPRRATLFTVDSASVPDWAGGLASFERDCILKHRALIPGLDTMIREETVDCVTFDNILEQLPVEPLDLLQVDSEGADGYILSLFPFERVRPAIVHWEVKHLSKTDREQCLARLAAFGYRFASSGDADMLAVNF
jgi:FkbM family methyltransferase